MLRTHGVFVRNIFSECRPRVGLLAAIIAVLWLTAGSAYAQNFSGTSTFRQRQPQKTHFAVIGEVMRPGVYQLPVSEISLVDFIEHVGGLTQQATGTIRVVRQGRVGLQTYFSKNTRLDVLPNDLLIVQSRSSSFSTVQTFDPRRKTSTVNGRSSKQKRPAVQIAFIDLINRPVVVEMSRDRAKIGTILKDLGQHPDTQSAIKIITPRNVRIRADRAKENEDKTLDSGTVLVFSPSSLDHSRIPPMPPATVDSFVPSNRQPTQTRPYQNNQPVPPQIDPRVAGIPNYSNPPNYPNGAPNGSYSATPPGRVRLNVNADRNNPLAPNQNTVANPLGPNAVNAPPALTNRNTSIGPYNNNVPAIAAPTPRAQPEVNVSVPRKEPSVLSGVDAEASPIESDSRPTASPPDSTSAVKPDPQPSIAATSPTENSTATASSVPATLNPNTPQPTATKNAVVASAPNTTTNTTPPTTTAPSTVTVPTTTPAPAPVVSTPGTSTQPVTPNTTTVQTTPPISTSPTQPAPTVVTPTVPAAEHVAVVTPPEAQPTSSSADVVTAATTNVAKPASSSNDVPGVWIAIIALAACTFAGMMAWSIAKQEPTSVERPKPPRYYLDALISDRLAVVEEQPSRTGGMQFHGTPKKKPAVRIDMAHELAGPHYPVTEPETVKPQQPLPIQVVQQSTSRGETETRKPLDLERLQNSQAAGLVKLAAMANSDSTLDDSPAALTTTIRIDGAHQVSAENDADSPSERSAIPAPKLRRAKPRANSIMDSSEDGSTLLDRVLSVVQSERRQ